MHAERMRDRGTTDDPPPRPKRPSCSVDGCTRPHNSKGLCTTHDERLRRTGSLADPVPMTAEQRFAHYLPADRDPTECWEWTGPRTTAGYGTLRSDKRFYYAHRYARERIDGPIPDGAVVMHSCDNPPCVNPAHLSVGSTWSNALDKVIKGRQHRGTAVTGAKLNEDAVRYIRAHFIQFKKGRASRSNAKDLAAMFDVTPDTIRGVARGSAWAWVPDHDVTRRSR